jgi:predicted nucleic acid-binding protein
VKYLLDVNALIALGHFEHAFHERVVRWLKAQTFLELITCPITELGFVRVLSQTPQYRSDVERAQLLLGGLKSVPDLAFTFLADDQDVSGLPGWVKLGGQTTDGHLLQLAKAHGAELATLDGKIPGAFLIPG